MHTGQLNVVVAMGLSMGLRSGRGLRRRRVKTGSAAAALVAGGLAAWASPAAAVFGVGDVTQPATVSVPGTINTEMGCANDWDPSCPQAMLSLDSNDEIWKGTYVLPAGAYLYKVALNGTWDEHYGAGGVRNGANIDLTSDGSTPITFFYDHRTNFVTSTAQGPTVTVPGSFQSEMGCSADWDPACMRSWLQDPDGDGIFTLSTTQVPPGSYEAKVALNRTWVENYGQNGIPDGANIGFTVPDVAGAVTTFRYDGATHVLTVATATPVPTSEECDGLPATIVGTAGDDEIPGTSGDDVIAGLGGDDEITGNGGHDVICGGEGKDKLTGNAGNDTINGDAGNDHIVGSSGNDTLRGEEGADKLSGGEGDDGLSGGDGAPDTCDGGKGTDNGGSGCEKVKSIP